MTAHDISQKAAAWDAITEYDVGVLICRYLQEHPAPPGSEVAARLRDCGEGFRDVGERHLSQMGLRSLRAVYHAGPDVEGRE
jgi:hypothetical protein